MPDYLNTHGNRGLFVSKRGTLNTDYYGLSTATAEWKIQMDLHHQAPSLHSPHPVWSSLLMEKRQINIEAGFAVITGEYAGIFGATPQPIYECSFAGCEEPIETHPRFVADIAGTPSNPKNGAIFRDPKTRLVSTDDSTAEFNGFSATLADGRNPLFGVQAYLSPEVTIRETWISNQRVSGLNMGKINTPPISINLSGGGNWLLTGASFQQRGGCYQNTLEWRGSGRNQWNSLIYG